MTEQHQQTKLTDEQRNQMKAAALALMNRLSDEDRLEIMDEFCMHCGSDNPWCRCWDDS